MNGKIRPLSEHTINQIAAGEVIENPASVIKELIENAIDADATRIDIDLLGGGYQLISVSDNGSGMSLSDARLCLERYATSKITQVDDLLSLSTMGFRGEALASIASISKMRLITAEDRSIGTQIDVEGGKVVYEGPISRPHGTTIEVRSLFYNVPARKKFQKSMNASTAEITKVVTQQALAHPHVEVHLNAQNHLLFSTSGTLQETFTEKICTRSQELLGDHFQKQLIIIDSQQEIYHLRGVIGSPLTHRHNRSGQYLFVNRRPVVSPVISYAIKDAYGTRIPSDRHPIFVLHLEIPSDRVDVNVHPQKTHIRLRDEQQLREHLRTAINQCLQGSTSRPSFSFPPPPEPLFDTPKLFSESHLPPALFQETSYAPEPVPTLSHSLDWIQYVGIYSHYLLIDALTFFELSLDQLPLFEFLKSFQQQPLGIIIVDLHAASACIAFDTLFKRPPSPEIARQGLLIPEILSVSSEEALLIHACETTFVKLGFDLHQCGKNQFLVEAIPSVIEPDQALDVLKTIITEMPRHCDLDSLLSYMATVTCRFTKGRKKSFLIQEAKEIFKQFIQTSSSPFCPNGRLTMIHVSHDEIKHKFLHPSK